jgi:hypothetical protein
MFISLTYHTFLPRIHFQNKFNEKSAEIFFEFEINSRSSGRRLSYIKKMLTLSVTWLTRQNPWRSHEIL